MTGQFWPEFTERAFVSIIVSSVRDQNGVAPFLPLFSLLHILIVTRQIWRIWKLRLAFSPETPNLGQNRRCFVPCDLEIGWMTLKNNRTYLLRCFTFSATFHSHRWIQTGVTVRKRLSGVLTSVTLTFDLWPWPFARTSGNGNESWKFHDDMMMGT